MTDTLFIGLNPSTADGEDDDHTSTKWAGFTERWHGAPIGGAIGADFSLCGRYRHRLRRPGYVAGNLFDWKSTEPTGLLEAHLAGNAISSTTNDRVLRVEAECADLVVACWGGPYGTKALQRLIAARVEQVLALLKGVGKTPQCLGQTKDGHPRHVLRLAYDTPLRPMVIP